MDRRLVKVALPAHLVDAMDVAVERFGYADRSAFVSDAVANLVAEVDLAPVNAPPEEALLARSGAGNAVSPVRARSLSVAERAMPPDPAPPGVGLSAVIEAPAGDVPLAAELCPEAEEPTWGMHNRDWPTLWAASELGRESYGGAVRYKQWVRALVDRSWDLAEVLSGDEFDTSGLPANRDKGERSAGRFQSFFVGNAPGDGPLFDLRLAAPAGTDAVLLTAPGAQLLRALAGLEPRRHAVVRDEWRHAFLTHLAAWVPKDFEFLYEIVELIAAGKTSRVDLLHAVDANHPEWTTESFVATNVAGFVARGREWNVIEAQQKDRKYDVVADAVEALDRARGAATGLRAEFE
jgi:Arc/MetJ-type ribon-helix-helix transcriptional regulator